MDIPLAIEPSSTNESPGPQSSDPQSCGNTYAPLLVSCPGAYLGSGSGTGGLVCLSNGQVQVLDSLDCTGLAVWGDRIYRAIRTPRLIVGYDQRGLCHTLKLPPEPDVQDLHDLVVERDRLVCVSTGTNTIHTYDWTGRCIDQWRADGEGDAWHLNCICMDGDRTFISAFGRFPTHNAWKAEGFREKGFVYNLTSGEDEITGLTGPHHPKVIDGELYVCDSLKNALVRKRATGEVERLEMGGFSRGLTWDEYYIYVGESANRYVDNRDTSYVAVVDRQRWQVVDRLEVPFPEIYELAIVPPAMAKAIAKAPDTFQLGFAGDAIQQLEEQIEATASQLRQAERAYRQLRKRPLGAIAGDRLKGRLQRLFRLS